MVKLTNENANHLGDSLVSYITKGDKTVHLQRERVFCLGNKNKQRRVEPLRENFILKNIFHQSTKR